MTFQSGATETPSSSLEVLISVRDQKLAVVCNGECVARYPVSTSRFGTGDSFGSYQTPLGEMRVVDKIGENLTPGAVIRHRSATGEVLPVNAPGRDPIVTRVIWLAGLEEQNRNAKTRGIYIHGTPEERTIGRPVSWGCIRMRSKDVIEVFDEIPVGTVVSVIPDKLPHMHRYEPPKEQPTPEAKPETKPEATPAAPPPSPSAAPAKPAPEPEKTAVADTQDAHNAHEPGTPAATGGEAQDHLKGGVMIAGLAEMLEKLHGTKTTAGTQ